MRATIAVVTPRNVKRTAAFGVIGAALAAMIAGATTSGVRRPLPLPLVKTTAIELQGAGLAAEIARLHERLRPSTEPQQPARNLFRFGAGASLADVGLPPRATDVAPAPLATSAPLNLVGIAEDPGADGPVRTAIISGAAELFLVKEGETVAARYRVTRIAGEIVELIDLSDGTTLRLVLK